MHAIGRKHGRFVALSGLKRIPGPPGSRFSLIIVDATGLPVFYLSEWYRRKKEFDLGRTSDTYLDLLLPWAGYLFQKGYAWNAPPERVRAYLVEFLRHDVGCQVGPAPEDGYLVETTGASPLAKSSLGVLLAALTSLYDVLIEAGYYSYQNPMRSERLTKLKREHLRQIKNAGAPDHAGIRSESHQETHHAYPTAFFRQKRGKVWEPDVVMEPDAVQERMRKALDFMIQHATFQRDKVILLLLRQTGARLSEIIEMTVGGYRKACHPERALVKNKGSCGREEKLIYFTPIVEQQLLSYIRTERATHDLQGRKRLEQLDETDPLFLTEDGKPYTRSAFYYHWYKLFEPAQAHCRKQERVEFSPHDIRHLRVSRALTKIKQDANGDKGREEELADGFWRLMGWRSRATMETYTHTLNKRLTLLTVMLEEEQQGGQAHQEEVSPLAGRDRPSQKTPPLPLHEEHDEFDWYEQ
jgi:site-specific recombinase XerD